VKCMKIYCSNIDVNFDGHDYLKKVDFSINQGERVLLYGPSGSGKTTFFKILCGLDKPTDPSGTVYWDDYSVDSLEKSNRVRYRYISMIYSLFFFLENLNVEKNILLPALFSGEEQTRVRQRLEMVYDVFSFGSAMDNLNLKDLSGRSINGLSNGQKELVGIARAFMLDSPFIFADELLRSYNKEAEEVIWEKVLSTPDLGIGKERGFFMITHKEHLRNDSRIDRVMTIENCKLVEMAR